MFRENRIGLARRAGSGAAFAVALLLPCTVAIAGEDEHAAHHAAMSTAPRALVTTAHYETPEVTLEDEKGRSVALRELLDGERPVIVNFIFTSCTSICPVMTATMLQLQKRLASDEPAPRFVSISIDPDFDQAEVLRGYAERYQADWTFLTGRREIVLRVLQAFDAWRGNKSNHVAVTLLRRSGAEWTRVEGLSSAADIAELWRSQVR